MPGTNMLVFMRSSLKVGKFMFISFNSLFFSASRCSHFQVDQLIRLYLLFVTPFETYSIVQMKKKHKASDLVSMAVKHLGKTGAESQYVPTPHQTCSVCFVEIQLGNAGTQEAGVRWGGEGVVGSEGI